MNTKKPTAAAAAIEEIPGQVPDSVYQGMVTKYTKVITIDVTKEDGTKVRGYYKKPDRNIIANCVNDASTGKIFEAREFLAQNTFIGGHADHQTNQDVQIPAQVELWKSLNFLKAEVIKD